MKMNRPVLCLVFASCLWASVSSASSSDADSSSLPTLFKVEGKVFPPDQRPREWFSDTRIVVDGGKKVGFLKVK